MRLLNGLDVSECVRSIISDEIAGPGGPHMYSNPADGHAYQRTGGRKSCRTVESDSEEAAALIRSFANTCGFSRPEVRHCPSDPCSHRANASFIVGTHEAAR